MKRFNKKASVYSIAGSIGLVVIASLSGCDNNTQTSGNTFSQAEQAKGYFIVIEEIAKDQYKVIEQYENPDGTTRAILKSIDGTEKLLSEEELKRLAAEEAKKVENGTSRLTQEQKPNESSGGLGLGEVILGSAAGYLMGSMISNMLFNNPNFQNRMKSNSAISRPATPSAAANSKATPSTTRSSGFMQNSTSTTKSDFGG